MSAAPGHVVVHRGDAVESRHRVHAVLAEPDGALLAHAGDPRHPTFLRSAAKPFQLAPLLASGAADALEVTDEELAVAVASHSGEPAHVDAVRSLLGKAGVPQDALACGVHAPFDEARAHRDGPNHAIHNNCSGKHASFLALARHLDAPPEGYLEPHHPVQQEVRDVLARAADVAPDALEVAVDGCGVPTYRLPLRAGARAVATWADPSRLDDPHLRDALERIGRVVERHPWYVAGTDRFDTELGDSSTALAAKVGAEGVQAVAHLDQGRGVLLKVEDGARRAGPPATMEVLRQLGWLDVRAFETLGHRWRPTVRNHADRAVGRLDPDIELDLAEGFTPGALGGPLP